MITVITIFVITLSRDNLIKNNVITRGDNVITKIIITVITSDNVITKIVIIVIKMRYLITPFYHYHFEHH
jgi:hypothetical protein